MLDLYCILFVYCRNMIKKVINYIFIYILLVLFIGCQDNIFAITDGECSNCVLELDIPELQQDGNDYYHLEFNEDYIQSFTKIQAYVGNSYVYVGWGSDTENCIQMWNNEECDDVVNPASYSGYDGLAHTMLGVYQEHVGDTITVHCGYYDDYGLQHLNKLEIIVDE